jgi:hypothetical protein
MTETTTSPAPGPTLPLFFKRLVGVDPNMHGTLRLNRDSGFRFAAETQFVPVGLSEIELAAHDYPILFTASPEPLPIALLGLQERRNSFLQSNGEWQPDCYVPAYVRAFPFVFLKNTTSEGLLLGMDPSAECLQSEEGEALFENGQPSAALKEVISFGAAHRKDLVAASEFARVMNTAGVLDEELANIKFASGAAAVIRGFKMVNRERLEKVNDDTFLEWRRNNWVLPVYAHLSSSGRWRRLLEMAASAQHGTSH